MYVHHEATMPIDGRMCDRMAPGMELIARYKGETYRVGVVEAEDGALRYRLPAGREFRTPSAAGSAVTGGIACNRWRFWSLAADEPEQSESAGEEVYVGTPDRQ